MKCPVIRIALEPWGKLTRWFGYTLGWEFHLEESGDTKVIRGFIVLTPDCHKP